MKVSYIAVQITWLEAEMKPHLRVYRGNMAYREVSLRCTVFKCVFKVCIHYIITVLKISF